MINRTDESVQKVPFSSLTTPVLLLDMDKLEMNIREMSHLAAEAGVRLRPHTKVHESVSIAKMQIEAGACGVETGSLEQAEGLMEEGVDDIVVAHPFYGGHKLEILKKLLNKPGLKITITVDMIEQAEDVSKVGQAVGRKVPVLIKVDTNTPLGGIPRLGVLPGEPTLNLAYKLHQLLGIELVGIYVHEMGVEPTADGVNKMAFEAASLTAETVNMLRKEGFKIEHASVGASATFRATCRYIKEGKFPEITEIHPGTCVIGDITQVVRFAMTEDRCALTVLTTVISTSHAEHAVIDAGFKTFSTDSLAAYREKPGIFWNDKPSFGSVKGRTDLWLGRLSAETGIVYYKGTDEKLNLGERIEIIPNNAILVINLHDQIYGVRNGIIEVAIPVTGRGLGS